MTGALLIVALLAQAAPAASKPIIENERVQVWTNKSPYTVYNADTVVVYSPSIVRMMPRGSAQVPKDLPANDRSLLMVTLKDTKVAPIPNPTGLPPAFPRPGIKTLLDTPRVTVWDYTWTLGQPTPMHFHDKDVVVMFLQEGDLESTTPDGQKTVNKYTPGTIRFNARNRAHYETLVRGAQRAIIVELK